jgi:hypothetical protein
MWLLVGNSRMSNWQPQKKLGWSSDFVCSSSVKNNLKKSNWKGNHMEFYVYKIIII